MFIIAYKIVIILIRYYSFYERRLCVKPSPK